MNKTVKISNEQYSSLVQISEYILSEVFTLDSDDWYIERTLLDDINAIIKEYERKGK